jgi:micrococcal nuclease
VGTTDEEAVIRRVGLLVLGAVVLLAISVLVYLAAPGGVPGSAAPPTAVSWGPSGVPSDAERARVVSHVDGDTIRLTGSGLVDGETGVRLLEIDTPEVGRDGATAECYAAEADAALAEMLPVGAPVWVVADRDLYDPYDRMLLYLWTDDGRFVNLELVRQGYARAVLFEPNDAHIEAMREAESRARPADRGLWGAC